MAWSGAGVVTLDVAGAAPQTAPRIYLRAPLDYLRAPLDVSWVDARSKAVGACGGRVSTAVCGQVQPVGRPSAAKCAAVGESLRWLKKTRPRRRRSEIQGRMAVMAPDPTAEWWTTTEVAEYLGVRVATVSTYRRRGQMPVPDQSLGRTHVWHPERIIAWHEGRPRPGVGGRPVQAPARSAGEETVATFVSSDSPSHWKVYGERVIYDNQWARLSLVDVEPPHGERYESHVVTLPPAAMTALIDDAGANVLLMWRHRFVADRWSWELPGGVVDAGEEPAKTAAREVEEETGYRVRALEHAVTFEPMVGQVRSPHHVFIGHGAEYIGEPTEKTEADRIEWVPIESIPKLIRREQVTNSGVLVALLYVLSGISHPDTAAKS